MMRELVCACVQCAICHDLSASDKGHSVRRRAGMALKATVNSRGSIPFYEIHPLKSARPYMTPFHDLLTLQLREQRKFRQAAPGISNQRFEHFHIVLRKSLNCCGIKQVRAEFQ